jgi:hypothetical protein
MKMPRSTVIRDKTRDRVVFIINRDYRVNVEGGLRADWGKLPGGGLGRVHIGVPGRGKTRIDADFEG